MTLDPLPAIAANLAAALRPYPCTRLPDYNGKPPAEPCRHCIALAEYDGYRAIVQLPGVPVKEQPK